MRQIEVRLRHVARAHVRVDDAPARDDREVGVRRRQRRLRWTSAVLSSATWTASAACARRAQRAGAKSGIRTSRLAVTELRGVTVVSLNSRPYSASSWSRCR